ncbi:type 3 dihydrofolate reductase [Buchnera aphidicola]|uniref:type 3 dihydrofolate reductase n=1 Tax=Buchnera aphidicola TaxID=9 RepID=UPI0034638A78
MKVSLIAAISNNLVIGHNKQIPWHLPKDLKWFKKNTIYKNVIMGRLTWESILSRPLPMRNNIVISHKKIIQENVISVQSIAEALIYTQHDKEIMVIGGEKIYQQMLFYANKLYLTHVDFNGVGDTYFPQYKLYKSWKIIFRKKYFKDKINPYNFCFEILSR